MLRMVTLSAAQLRDEFGSGSDLYADLDAMRQGDLLRWRGDPGQTSKRIWYWNKKHQSSKLVKYLEFGGITYIIRVL